MHYAFWEVCDVLALALAFLDLLVIGGFSRIFLTLGPAKAVTQEASAPSPQLRLQVLFRR